MSKADQPTDSGLALLPERRWVAYRRSYRIHKKDRGSRSQDKVALPVSLDSLGWGTATVHLWKRKLVTCFVGRRSANAKSDRSNNGQEF